MVVFGTLSSVLCRHTYIQCPFLGGSLLEVLLYTIIMFWHFNFALMNQYHWSLQEICCDLISVLSTGPKPERMNVHMLQHLVFHVKNWWPLWAFSCFSFESLNGFLKNFFHGTRNMSMSMSMSEQVLHTLLLIVELQ